MKKPTLYSKDSNGRVRTWSICVETRNDTPCIVIEQGLINNPTEYVLPITNGTNIGKNNATTPYEQACKEAESRWKLKRKQGYKSTFDLGAKEGSFLSIDWIISNLPINSTDDNGNLRPMKCKPFEYGRMVYPAIAQPKLNGVRCVMRIETINDGLFGLKRQAVLRSKDGLEYVLPHITNAAMNYIYNNPDNYEMVFDGELYIHGKRLNIIKKHIPMRSSNGTVSKSEYDTSNVQFWMFDLSIPDVHQADRSQLLYEIYKDIPVGYTLNTLKHVETIPVTSDDLFITLVEKWINEGYEGGIIRNLSAVYRFGSRPFTIMKCKKYKDGEFIIVDIIQKNETQSVGGIRTYICFICKNDINAEIFEAVPLGNEKERLEYLANRQSYIGKKATIKYYERSGVKNVPFHGNVVTVRDYE